MNFKVLSFLLFFVSTYSLAENYEFSIHSYKIEGLIKTHRKVIETEIKICNCGANPEILKQQILATGLFHEVDVNRNPNNQISIIVKEKWTTIPILKLNSGGGVNQTTFGVYDPNIMGNRIEFGTQYESLGGAPSFVIWNKVPRISDSKYFTDVQYWNTKRIRLKYDQTEDSPVLTKALLHESEKFYFGLGYESTIDLRIRAIFESHQDQFTTDFVSDKYLAKVSGQIVPPSSKYLFLGSQLDWGQLNTIRHSPEGHLVTVSFKYAKAQEKGLTDFTSARIEYLAYKHSKDFIFANRIQAGATNTKVLQYWNYLGGLESIRGFADNRFAARNFWLVNSEMRKSLSENRDRILQGISFLDFAGIDESGNDYFDLHAASFGLGGRLILPKLYRVIVRLDFAIPILKNDDERISFGIQQFF